jgi:hypothetical protein
VLALGPAAVLHGGATARELEAVADSRTVQTKVAFAWMRRGRVLPMHSASTPPLRRSPKRSPLRARLLAVAVEDPGPGQRPLRKVRVMVTHTRVLPTLHAEGRAVAEELTTMAELAGQRRRSGLLDERLAVTVDGLEAALAGGPVRYSSLTIRSAA